MLYNIPIITSNMHTVSYVMWIFRSTTTGWHHLLNIFRQSMCSALHHVTDIQWMKTSDATWSTDVQLLAIPVNSAEPSFYLFRNIPFKRNKPSRWVVQRQQDQLLKKSHHHLIIQHWAAQPFIPSTMISTEVNSNTLAGITTFHMHGLGMELTVLCSTVSQDPVVH